MLKNDYVFYSLIVSMILVIMGIAIVGSKQQTENIKSETKMSNSHIDLTVDFNDVGYFKADNKLRYFTVYAKPSKKLDDKNIEVFYQKLLNHGSNQMNTKGCVTATFYYLNKDKTPYITTLKSAQRVNNIAHEYKPISSVWIMPNGQINLIKKPK